jgi:hypothetical protein
VRVLVGFAREGHHLYVDITDLTTPYYLLMHETMRYRPRVRAFADFVAAEINAFRASISGVEVDRM